MYAITLINPDDVSFVFLGEIVSSDLLYPTKFTVMHRREGGGDFVGLGIARMVRQTVFSIDWSPPLDIQGGQIRMEPVARKTTWR